MLVKSVNSDCISFALYHHAVEAWLSESLVALLVDNAELDLLLPSSPVEASLVTMEAGRQFDE